MDSSDSTYRKGSPWRGSHRNTVMPSPRDSIDVPENSSDTKHRSKPMRRRNQICCTSNLNLRRSASTLSILSNGGCPVEEKRLVIACQSVYQGISHPAYALELKLSRLIFGIRITKCGSCALLWNYVFGASVYYSLVYAQIATAKTFI